MLKEQLLNEIKVPDRKQMFGFKISFYLLFIVLLISFSFQLYKSYSISSKLGFSIINANEALYDAFESDLPSVITSLTCFYKGLLHLVVFLCWVFLFRTVMRTIKKNKKLLSIVEQIPDNV